MKIERLGDVQCIVGEGPIWDVQTGSLYFVDLVKQILWRYQPDTGRFDNWQLPKMVAGFTLDDAGDGVIALADGFYKFDLESGAISATATPTLEVGTQVNDVKVDRDGRFVGGSMNRDMQTANCGLFSLDKGELQPLDDDYILVNGPCWSPDGMIFYCADSMRHRIYAYNYDRANGKLSNRRVFTETGTEGGIPDGATVDEDGNLWVAMLGSGNIVVYAADGSIVRRVAMPTKWVASVAFGGPDLDRLFVTTLDPSVAGQQPDEGATYLYVVDGLGVRGIADRRARI